MSERKESDSSTVVLPPWARPRATLTGAVDLTAPVAAEPEGGEPESGDETAIAGRRVRIDAAGDFEIEGELGPGAWQARQGSLDRPVVLKSLPAAEAHLVGRLEHPNIVPVHAYGRDPAGRPFLCTKVVRGRTWAELAGKRDMRADLETFASVCDAVAFAHANGVIHRDLEPEHVTIGEFGEVLVGGWEKAIESAEGRWTDLRRLGRILAGLCRARRRRRRSPRSPGGRSRRTGRRGSGARAS